LATDLALPRIGIATRPVGAYPQMQIEVKASVLANHEIAGPVICAILIDVMHRRTLRQIASQCLLRDQNMLSDPITMRIRPRMTGLFNVDVPVINNRATAFVINATPAGFRCHWQPTLDNGATSIFARISCGLTRNTRPQR
jgi:hypothetical protein